VDGQSAASVGAAITPTPNATAPAIEAAASQTKMTGDEIRAMNARAKGLIAIGDIAAARRLAEYVAAGGDGGALFILATTFDPKQLARWRVRGVRADIERARDLYRQALQRGVAEAQNHLAALP
jgi:TPR repeat protein